MNNGLCMGGFYIRPIYYLYITPIFFAICLPFLIICFLLIPIFSLYIIIAPAEIKVPINTPLKNFISFPPSKFTKSKFCIIHFSLLTIYYSLNFFSYLLSLFLSFIFSFIKEYISCMAIIAKKIPKYFLKFSEFIFIAILLPINAPITPKTII